MRLLTCALVLICLVIPVLVAAGGRAHVHGAAALDIAVEANRVTLLLDSPLDNLLAFERAPRTDAERRQADEMIFKLRAGETLFKIDPAAQCTLGRVQLTSGALKLGAPEPAADDDGHADVDGSFEFTCREATRATYIEVGLLDAFPRLQRLDLQVATPRGQFKRELKRPVKRIVLPQ